MDCLFDHRVDRSGVLTWLKDAFTPQSVKDAGLLGYAGAEFEFPLARPSEKEFVKWRKRALSVSLCPMMPIGTQ